MITKDDLKTLNVADENIDTVIELLGDAAKKLSSANEAKNAFDTVDRFMLTMTGIEKGADEKTTDYIKKAFDHKLNGSVEEKKKEFEAEIAKLKEEAKNHKGDETLKEKIKELEAEKERLPDLKNEWIKEHKDRADAAEAKFAKYERETQLRSSMPKLNEGDRDFIEFKINQALEKSEKFDKLEADKDGNLFMIDSVNVNKVSAEDFWKESLGNLVDNGRSQSGGGASGGSGGSGGQGGEVLDLEGKSDSQKMTAIQNHLRTVKGISDFDPNWTKEYNAALKDNGLDQYAVITEEK